MTHASRLEGTQPKQQSLTQDSNFVVQRSCPNQIRHLSAPNRNVLAIHNPLLTLKQSSDSVWSILQQRYLETYFAYVYAWCPILDRELLQTRTEFSESSFLQEGLAILGSNLRPSLIDHVRPSEHYQWAKAQFYNNAENNPLVRICGVMLLQYWSSNFEGNSPLESRWWWTGVAIRLAQEAGIHRESRPTQQGVHASLAGLRRRIWWTLFVSSFFVVLSMKREPDDWEMDRQGRDSWPAVKAVPVLSIPNVAVFRCPRPVTFPTTAAQL